MYAGAFSGSTNEGKLYINYPMVEACRHFAAFPDPPFLTRSIRADEVKRYKALVGEETAYQNFQRSFSKREFDSAITHSLVEGFSLIGEKCNPPECWKRSAGFDHAQLLAYQSSTYAVEKKLPVLGTCLFFVLDYSPFLIDLHEGDDGLFRQ